MGQALNKQEYLTLVLDLVAAVSGIVNNLGTYGVGKNLFLHQSPEDVSGNVLVIRSRSLDQPTFLGENQLVMQESWVDVDLMCPNYVQPSDSLILTLVNSTLHAVRSTSISGYLIDIIYDSALPTNFLDVNSVKYQVEGIRFKLIIRPEDF